MSTLQKSASAIRVFPVSDHQVLLWGLQQLIAQRAPAFHLCGAAASCDEALRSSDRCHADIILLDMDSGTERAIEAIPHFTAAPKTSVLLLTRLNDQAAQDRAILAGARGIVKQETSPDMLFTAITKVHHGQMWLDRDATGRIFVELSRRATRKPSDQERNRGDQLTERERQIVTHIAENSGDTGKAIARQLHISESTLRNHLTSIYEKLGVANRHGLLAYAFKNGVTKAAG